MLYGLGFLAHKLAHSSPLMATGSHHQNPSKPKKKKNNQNPINLFHYNLNTCSKSKDLNGAISLYETAISQNTRLNQGHFNTLLYLCSNSFADPSSRDLALQYGFRIFDHMVSNGINPNEATVTAIARLAAAKGDGDYAFGLTKRVVDYGFTPRLRTYDPALFCFCENMEADRAYEVEEHMGTVGLSSEEPELAALLKVSSETGRGDRVYRYLHKLRNSIRCISESTAKIVGDWFCSAKGSEVVGLNFDVGLIKEAILMNGGGWHGLGWIGEGKWVVRRGNVDSTGVCCSCGGQLVCVDIGDAEAERFAQSVAGLAMERKVQTSFDDFQEWLEKHSDYEAVIDGANVGLYQQNFADGGFSVSQLDAVVEELYNASGKKWPLIILHNKRLRGLLDNPSYRKIVQDWIAKDVLYTTPHGSNDDWYWLYAAVKRKCLLVTNDEMRDHIFELLGSSFFMKWKERHQVRYTFAKGSLKLQMPPPYSLVIQESERGSWHLPIALNNIEETAQAWLCINRSSACKTPEKGSLDIKISGDGHGLCCNDKWQSPCESKSVTHNSEILLGNGSSESCDNKSLSIAGKRKGRSPSPSQQHN